MKRERRAKNVSLSFFRPLFSTYSSSVISSPFLFGVRARKETRGNKKKKWGETIGFFGSTDEDEKKQ